MLVFMVLYMIDVTGFFACLLALSRGGKPMETIADMAGLMRERPGMALAMTGLRRLGHRLSALLAASGPRCSCSGPSSTRAMGWVAAVGLVLSVVAAFYYLRLIKVMWFDPAARGKVDAAPARRQGRRGYAAPRPCSPSPWSAGRPGPRSRPLTPRRRAAALRQVERRSGSGGYGPAARSGRQLRRDRLHQRAEARRRAEAGEARPRVADGAAPDRGAWAGADGPGDRARATWPRLLLH